MLVQVRFAACALGQHEGTGVPHTATEHIHRQLASGSFTPLCVSAASLQSINDALPVTPRRTSGCSPCAKRKHCGGLTSNAGEAAACTCTCTSWWCRTLALLTPVPMSPDGLCARRTTMTAAGGRCTGEWCLPPCAAPMTAVHLRLGCRKLTHRAAHQQTGWSL